MKEAHPTFLKRHHEKKAQEKEERKQRRIMDYFPLIKKEPNNYDGDDEMSGNSEVNPIGSQSSTCVIPSSATSPNGRWSATPTERHTPPTTTSSRQCATASKRPPSPVAVKISPELLNKISPSVMPQGTFIPISVSFESMVSTAKTSSEVLRNLMQSFEEDSIKSPSGNTLVKVGIITSTSQERVSPAVSDFNGYQGLMVNKEVGTNSCILSDVQTQTEVEPIIYKPIFQTTGMQSEDGIVQCNDSQAQTDLLAKHVFDKEEQDKSMPILQESEAQTDLMSSDVINKQQQDKSRPILQESEAQTDLMSSDVIDKQEQNKIRPILQENDAQTNLMSSDVIDKKDQEKDSPILQGNESQTNLSLQMSLINRNRTMKFQIMNTMKQRQM